MTNFHLFLIRLFADHIIIIFGNSDFCHVWNVLKIDWCHVKRCCERLLKILSNGIFQVFFVSWNLLCRSTSLTTQNWLNDFIRCLKLLSLNFSNLFLDIFFSSTYKNSQAFNNFCDLCYLKGSANATRKYGNFISQNISKVDKNLHNLRFKKRSLKFTCRDRESFVSLH